MTAVSSALAQRVRWQVPHLFALVVLFSAIAPELQAQRFAERTTLSPRRRAGVAYDQTRGRMVLFGGAQNRGTNFVSTAPERQTFEWDSRTWTRRLSLFGEPRESDSTRAMIYHPDLGKVVLVQFVVGQVFEMWTWEGLRWSAVNTTRRPTFRQHFSIAYDEIRQRIVMWGGSEPTGPQLDVWEYDGSNWTAISAPGPSGANDATLAWDGVRGKVILFGGRTTATPPVPVADMFEWDGAAWTRLTPATLPPGRSQHSMTWDPVRQRVVMFGGGLGVPGTLLNDTWEWDGTNWAQVRTTTAPTARCGHGATFHPGRGRVVITCGENANDLLADTWEFNGTNWSVALAAESPSQRSDHGVAYDDARGRSVLFGGKDPLGQSLGDTWIWDLSRWTQVIPGAAPSARHDHAMVSDVARGNVVLFGGLASGLAQNDTWLWNGTSWSLAAPTSRPSARYAHAMAYDSVRNRVVLFGGTVPAGTLLNDTWEWDGVQQNWQQVTTPSTPLARADHAMTFDAAPGRVHVLLYGGRTSPSLYSQEIWSYDGATWFNRTPTTGVQPGLKGNVGFVFDPRLNKSFVYGGQVSASGFVATVHDWNGTNWTAPLVGIAPPARGGHSMIWDAAGRRTLIFGGESTNGVRRSDTWILTTTALGLVEPAIPSACSGGSPSQLTGFGIPSVGNPSFALDFTSSPPTAASPVFFFLSLTQGTASIGSCPLVVDPATLFFTAYRLQINSLASLALPIPPSTNLFGARFFAQCMFVNPPSNLNGIALSAGVPISIGDF